MDEPKAVHFEGGNLFDDLRIDIAESHRRLESLNTQLTRRKRRSRIINTVALYFTAVCLKLGIHEFLAVNGFRNKWFIQFGDYWSNILGARPLTSRLDFFLLAHDYRRRQQHTAELEWNDADQHIANWQHPREFYLLLNAVRRVALHPIVGRRLWRYLRSGMRVLEYGCSLAPYYYCYREYFSHKSCNFVLADIPNYPFHYAKYLYRNEPDVEFVTIESEDFGDPLGQIGGFDVIVLTTVLEHLDAPLFVVGYLLNRLEPGGLFVFDYVRAHGHGLDHPNAAAERSRVVELILKSTQVLHGNVDVNEDIGFVICRKK